jgi:outer membrane protein
MTSTRFRLPQLTAFGLILGQAFGLGIYPSAVLAQSANGAKPSLPTPVNAQSLVGLDLPPQIAPLPRQAIPSNSAPSNLANNSASASSQTTDLIRLYQEAAFSDPVLNAARFLSSQ